MVPPPPVPVAVIVLDVEEPPEPFVDDARGPPPHAAARTRIPRGAGKRALDRIAMRISAKRTTVSASPCRRVPRALAVC
jgi:hypothetical protein